MDNIAHYDLMIPDIATFEYIDGDAIKTANCDYFSAKSSDGCHLTVNCEKGGSTMSVSCHAPEA